MRKNVPLNSFLTKLKRIPQVMSESHPAETPFRHNLPKSLQIRYMIRLTMLCTVPPYLASEPKIQTDFKSDKNVRL